MIKPQWFVKMDELIKPAVKAVKPVKSRLFLSGSRRCTLTGPIILEIGAYPDSFGGAIEFRHITVTAAVKPLYPRKNHPDVIYVAVQI